MHRTFHLSLVLITYNYLIVQQLKKRLSLLRPGTAQCRIYYYRMCGQLSTTCSNAIEVAQWGDPSCSLPLSATDNGFRDGRSN